MLFNGWRRCACDSVIADVVINGTPLVLKREISDSKERPMSIFWGDFESANKSGPTDWQTYPFAQRGTAQSFSQVIFRALGIPEVRGELASRVTMNQILRLLFCDQQTPSEEVFRQEKFSRNDTLDAVGSLLCGTYNDRIYEIGFELQQKSSERDEMRGQLKALWKLLGSTDHAQGLSLLVAELEKTRMEAADEYRRLNEYRANRQTVQQNATGGRQKLLFDELEETKNRIVEAESQLRSLEFEFQDSALFIDALENNLKALNDSTLTRSQFGEVTFEFCPACFGMIENATNDTVCALCKKPLEEQGTDTHILRMKQELALQLQESKLLQDERIQRIQKMQADLAPLRAKNDQLQLAYNEVATTVTTDVEQAISESCRRIGYLTRTIEDLEKQLQLAGSIDALERRQADLAREIELLEAERVRLAEARAKKEQDAFATICETVKELLVRDTPVETAFQSPDSVDFSFRDNTVRVNGRSNFSASSKVILKNCFHLAMLLASTRKEYFRYPRFVLFDNIEDKGMTPDRSHNFQKLIVEKSNESQVEHQIIFTTAMISPDLEVPSVTVGECFTPARKSLRLQSHK